jgi:hypothetical protein
MIPYDGEKSASVASYNYCFLCKDRLEVIHDDFDEGWYFINSKQIRCKPTDVQEDLQVVNVHAQCLKEIELNEKQEKRA